MAIPDVMLNDDIKAYDVYSKYVAKSKGSTPAKATGQGKGLLMKEGVKVDVQRISVPKRRRSKTMTKEFQINIKKSIKARRHDFFIQPRPRGLDEPCDYSSSSSSDSEFASEDIPSDDDIGDKDVNVNAAADDNLTNDKDLDVNATEEKTTKEQGDKIPLKEREFVNQFINDNPDNPEWSINEPLKEPVHAKLASTMEVPNTQEDPASSRPLLVDTTISLNTETTISPSQLSPKQAPIEQSSQSQQKRSKTKRLVMKSKKSES
nr:hypothetical protein [Tanacetum cinerariifolium]